MQPLLVASNIILWVLALLLGFLLLGALRALARLTWRFEELEATRPGRMDRDGLKPGARAPDFTLPRVEGGDTSLHDFAGRQVLLTFVQPNCGPCHAVVPDLNRLAQDGEVQVLVVNNAEPQAARQWAEEVGAAVAVLVQERWSVSKRYKVLATPFAFLIDESGVVAARGIVNNSQHIGFLLSAARDWARDREAERGEPQPRAEALVSPFQGSPD